MTRKVRVGTVLAIAALAIASISAASADPPPGWVGQEINLPTLKGSVDVDAGGVWTLQGAGDDIYFEADQCYYVYQPVAGDASLTARFLSFGRGHEFRKAGLMVRQDVTPGSPNLNYHVRGTSGLNATLRFRQNRGSTGLWDIGPGIGPQQNVSLRLQRMGQQIAGFYSRDGVLWVPDFEPVILPTLPDQALFGLAICSISHTERTSARFDQVQLASGAVMVPGLRGCAGDRRVQLQWQPLHNAVGYQIYRGPGGATPAQLVRLTSDRVVGTSFVDTEAGLANGVTQTYAVAPVFRQSDGNLVEGPQVAVEATPTGVPAGWLGCSINEGPHPGFAAIDAVTGEVTLRGSGYHGFTGEEPLFRNTDQGYFLGQAVEGDFQITVKSLTKPKATDADARAVLMIRESLGSGSRYTSVGLTATHGLFGQHRTTEYGATNWSKGLANASLSLPITLRLTRRGSIITREYSTDDGKTFQLVGNPITFVLPLAQVVQAGLIVSSNVRARVSEARFSFPQIQKL